MNSNEESKSYSREAIELVMRYMDGYLANTEEGNAGMLHAANTAGKAINITQTTAGHAMCYKITSLFKVAHGHAAILCVRVLFPWMVKNTDKCTDPRGESYLLGVFQQIAGAMGCDSAESAAEKVNGIFADLELEVPVASCADFELMKNSVNPDRLKNHPIALDIDTIDMLYHQILKGEQNEG